MSDLDKLIRQALSEVGDSYSPADEHAARFRFLERRRKRRRLWFAGTAAATAMAVAVALFVVPGRLESPEDPIQVAARPLEVVETIEVGGAPASTVSDGEAVWVSNAAGNSVVRIDPETNEVEAVLGREGQIPDELVVSGSNLWVGTREGVITRLDSHTGEILADSLTPQLEPSGERKDVYLDIAATSDVLWVTDPSAGSLYAIPVRTKQDLTARPIAGEGSDLSLTDVATDEDKAWALARDGSIHQLGGTSTMTLVTDPIEDVTGGANADLAVGLGYIWVSSGDDDDLRVYRIDPSGEQEVLEIPLEGRYADLTVADGRLWVLASGGEESLLYRVTPDGAIEGDHLALPATANDIAVGAGSVWVPDTDAGTVLRIEEVAGDEPEPVATEPADEETSAAQPFFAYSVQGGPSPDAGDIFVEMTDGTTKQITMSPDEELNPTFLLDGSLVFERHDYETDWRGLVRHDLATGEESSVPLPDGWDGGAHPAVSVAGDLAAVLTRSEGETIVIWSGYFTEERADGALEVPLPEDLSDARNLVFSDDAGTLYYQAIGEGWVTVQLPWREGEPPTPFVLNGVNDQPSGTTYVQPEDATDRNITVLDVCCRSTEGDAYSQFSIARILFTEGGATHQGITGPVGLQDPDPGALEMVSLHGAVPSEDGSWELFAEDGGSWLVTDGAGLWLLSRDGSERLAPETLEAGELGGFAVNPFLIVEEDF